MEQDIRWRQRYENYSKALSQLSSALELMRQRGLSELEKQGLIQSFEYTYELGWNMLKDYLAWQGIENIVGSRDAIRESYKTGLVADGSVWMAMLQDRNRTTHTYNEKTAASILSHIAEQYHDAFSALQKKFKVLINNEG